MTYREELEERVLENLPLFVLIGNQRDVHFAEILREQEDETDGSETENSDSRWHKHTSTTDMLIVRPFIGSVCSRLSVSYDLCPFLSSPPPLSSCPLLSFPPLLFTSSPLISSPLDFRMCFPLKPLTNPVINFNSKTKKRKWREGKRRWKRCVSFVTLDKFTAFS